MENRRIVHYLVPPVLLALTVAASAAGQLTSQSIILGPGVAEVLIADPEPPKAPRDFCHERQIEGLTGNTEAPASLSEQRYYADRFLNGRLGYWRKQLKLDEWQVSIVMVRRDNLRPKTLGKIRWDKKKKTAAIEVMDPADYKLAFRPMLDDMEFTVVHELVHLGLASLPRSEASRSSEEHAVNRIAGALVSLDGRHSDELPHNQIYCVPPSSR